MSITQIHYNIDNISKENANFNIIYGEKSNGKSYQVKHKKGVEHYLETGMKFILLRRWREDITPDWLEKYFHDVDVSKLTNGKYSTITSYRKNLYFANYIAEKNKIVRGECIGYAVSLNTEQRNSGASYLDVDMIIFEEFMERGGVYIAREPDRLMTFYSTVDRKRGVTQMWLVGNTISRVNPYLREWNLQPILRKQKQGDIDTVIVHNEENDVKIAIEYCRSSGGKTMTIGNASKMIDKGEWQTNPQPHLPKSIKNYKKLYCIGFFFKGFKFLGELLIDRQEKDLVWLIRPETKDFKKDLIVFSDIIKTSIYWQRNPYDITIKNRKIQEILINTFRESNIFYANDLCGTDFKECIDFQIRR